MGYLFIFEPMKRIVLLWMLAVTSAVAQDRTFRFRVVADSVSVEGIHAANLVNERSAITDSNGYFVLPASEDDLIVLSAVNFEYTRKLIDADDLKQDVVIIRMTPKVHQLREVTINQHPEINALSLGIISKPIKQYTPAERRLAQAGDFKWWHLIGIIGGQLPIDPILNAISGRTAMLKKEVIAERRNMLREKLLRIYEERYFTEELHIPREHVDGFLYYAAENSKIADVVATKNNTKITFALTELAAEYNAILKKQGHE